MATTQAQPVMDIPDHVPPELVREIGLTTGPEFLAAPHAFMAKLHETHPPIFYSVNPLIGNSWCTIKHEDAFFALRHPEYFTTAGATPFPRDPNNYFHFIPLEIDPPHHRKYRAILDSTFSPQSVLRLEAYMRSLTNDLIDGFIDAGEVEFTTALPTAAGIDLPRSDGPAAGDARYLRRLGGRSAPFAGSHDRGPRHARDRSLSGAGDRRKDGQAR
ncbi:hypothetical protein ACFSUK_19230 [Sphingobium scionense]